MNNELIEALKEQMPDFESELLKQKKNELARELAKYKPYKEEFHNSLMNMLIAISNLTKGWKVEPVKTKKLHTSYQLVLIKPKSVVEQEQREIEAEINQKYDETLQAKQADWLDNMLLEHTKEKAKEAADNEIKKLEQLKFDLLSAIN